MQVLPAIVPTQVGCALALHADTSRLLVLERPSLLRAMRRMVGSESAAEDVAQSLWLKVQRIDDDLPIRSKRSFLFRLASNLATDHVRSESGRANVQMKAQAYLWAELEAPSPEQAAIAHDELARRGLHSRMPCHGFPSGLRAGRLALAGTPCRAHLARADAMAGGTRIMRADSHLHSAPQHAA